MLRLAGNNAIMILVLRLAGLVQLAQPVSGLTAFTQSYSWTKLACGVRASVYGCKCTIRTRYFITARFFLFSRNVRKGFFLVRISIPHSFWTTEVRKELSICLIYCQATGLNANLTRSKEESFCHLGYVGYTSFIHFTCLYTYRLQIKIMLNFTSNLFVIHKQTNKQTHAHISTQQAQS
jgi:hypothetical protein